MNGLNNNPSYLIQTLLLAKNGKGTLINLQETVNKKTVQYKSENR